MRRSCAVHSVFIRERRIARRREGSHTMSPSDGTSTSPEGVTGSPGTTLDVVATSTGHMLVFSGKVLAFIPNELGKALLHHEKVT